MTPIDRLYQLPLEEFVAARNELGRQARGDEAKAIRALAKPNLIAWALNQVYWSSRPVFDSLVAAAARLREAQARALTGQSSDLRGAGAVHREAVDAAVREATAVLEKAGHDATADTLRALRSAFEALPWEEAGRLARPPSLSSGFGAFAGMPASASVPADEEVGGRDTPSPARKGNRPLRGQTRLPRASPPHAEVTRPSRAARAAEARAEAERARQRELEDRQRRAREAIEAARVEAAAAERRRRTAEEELVKARHAERAARDQLEAAQERVRGAEAGVRDATRDATAADAAVRKAEAAAFGRRAAR